MAEYGTFAKFHTPEEAEALIQLLEEEKIPYLITQERNQLDSLFIGEGMDPMFTVSIPVDRFSKVNNLAAKTFTYIVNDEAELAEKLEPFDRTQPERLPLQWIILGYILSLFMAVGIMAGLAITQSTKRLSDGTKMKIYDTWTIRHGRIIIVIGIVVAVWWLTRFFNK